MPVPVVRIRSINTSAARPDQAFVLYWMTAYRRLSSNFALQHAVEQARTWKKPLVILEALRCDYPWASDRLHRFVIDGIADHARALKGAPVTYLPYVEPARGAGKGLLELLAADACLVVTDDFPSFFLPRMVAAAGRRLQTIGVRLDAVESNGVLPMRATTKVFLTASAEERALRRHKQLKEKGIDVSLRDLSRGIADRDQRDASRSVAPLRPAGDARVLDSTELSPADVVRQVLEWLQAKGIPVAQEK